MRFKTEERADQRLAYFQKRNAEGAKRRVIAHEMGFETTGALTHWLRRNFPDIHEATRERIAPGSGRNVAPEEAIRRLRVLVHVQATGLDIRTLASWARTNVPDGDYALALEDYAGDE